MFQQCVANLRLQPDPGVSLASRGFASDTGADSDSSNSPSSSAQESSAPSDEGLDSQAAHADNSAALEAAGSEDEDGLSGGLDSLSAGGLEAGSKNPAQGPGALGWHLGEPFHHVERYANSCKQGCGKDKAE